MSCECSLRVIVSNSILIRVGFRGTIVDLLLVRSRFRMVGCRGRVVGCRGRVVGCW